MDRCCAGSESTMGSINSSVAAQELVRAAHAWRRNNVAVKVDAHRAVACCRVGTGGEGQCDRAAGRHRMTMRRVGWIGLRHGPARIEAITGKEALWISRRWSCTPGRAMRPQVDRRRRAVVEYRCGGVSYIGPRRYHNHIGVHRKVGIKCVVRMNVQGPSGWRERIRLRHGVLPNNSVRVIDGDINVDRGFPQMTGTLFFRNKATTVRSAVPSG